MLALLREYSAIDEVDHARESMWEGGRESRADIRVELLSKVGEAGSAGLVRGAVTVLAMRRASTTLGSVAKAATSTRHVGEVSELHR